MSREDETGTPAPEKSPQAPGAKAGEGLPESTKNVFELIDEMDVPELEKSIAKLIVALGGNPTDVLVAGAYRKMTAESEREHPRKPLPEDYTETERVIHEMLIENTGAHPLDSGALYGRHWERNREVEDFRKTPEIYVNEYSISINVFHYLTMYLERDKTSEVLERLLYEFADRPENMYSSWLDIMIDFADQLESLGWTVHPPFNTYNFDNFLSQVLQGIVVENGEDSYIILQIHNGCDVRGGYTKPRVFKLLDPEEFFFNMDEILAGCGCRAGYIDAWGYHDFDPDHDDKSKGFPKDWRWNKRKKKYVCRRCRKPVTFSIYE